MSKHICIISEGYPYNGHAYFTFVKQLCVAIADQGWKVSVISPISLTKSLIHKNMQTPPYRRIERTENGHEIEIYAPQIFTIGNLCKIPILYRIVMRIRQKAISHIVESMHDKPDVLYGHFWHSAYAAYKVAREFEIPLYGASGEAEIELHKYYSEKKLKPFVDYVSGVICVSTKNKNESISNNLTVEHKCIVIPNAVDQTLFYKRDKSKQRLEFGFKKEDFIVAFVGGFIYRKGAKRISDAITKLDDKGIKSIFIGSLATKDDSELPNCEGILYRGSLPHDKIPYYLNAADIFVMPTLHEGCCNANIEALACGLPVISSNRDFNYDILDETCAVLIDPLNISEIADAIAYLKENKEVLADMSGNALKKSATLDIKTRAKKILSFIKNTSR